MLRTVIAIDGLAGSGKSTLARRLAAELGLPYVNTGLMYRALALRALVEGADPDDEGALEALAERMTFDLDTSLEPAELSIDGEPPSASLTSPEVESSVSRVARHSKVRRIMRDEQRRLGEAGAVMEGRDIGSVVFTDATLRIYLEAHPEERAARRALERERAPIPEVERAISARDAQDSRNVPPVEADLVIDTTDLDADGVLRVALAAVRRRLGEEDR
jgi:cytidylate kinase